LLAEAAVSAEANAELVWMEIGRKALVIPALSSPMYCG
jgi:hypothetical protein